MGYIKIVTATAIVFMFAWQVTANTKQISDGNNWRLKAEKEIIPPSDIVNSFTEHSDDSLVLLPKIPCPVVVLNGVKCQGREAARKLERSKCRPKQRTLIKK